MSTATEKQQTPKGWLGRPLPRREDARLLTGQARFMAELTPVANIHAAAILRSPYAHARITAIDTSAAERMPGVEGVLTGADVARMAKPFPVGVDAPMAYYPCAVDRVRYVGEPVAVVVAKDRYLAEDALAAIEVEYEALPAVVETEAALQEDAPVLHEAVGRNLIHHRTFRYGDPEAAFESAHRIVSGKFYYPKTTPTPLETYGVIAEYDAAGGGYQIWANFHGPFSLHTVLAAALRVPLNRLRVMVPPDVGGSFGIKSAVYPYMALMALASRKLGVPVKWVEDRMEHLAASSSAADRVTWAEAAVTAEGIITGLRLKLVDNVGAYVRAPEPACLYRTHGNTTGAYHIRNLAIETAAVVSNKAPTGLYRGYGAPPLYFALESLVNRVADELGLDPAEVRRRNLIAADAFPYRTVTGGLYDSGNYQAVLEQALAGYDQLRAVQAQARQEGRLVGIGIACAVEPSGSNMGYIAMAETPEARSQGLPKSGAIESVSIGCDLSGGFILRLGTTPTGQGHETAAAQVAADVLGVAPDEIQVLAEMDTFNRPWSIATGSYSSRFAPLSASAVAVAARRMRERLATLAGHLLNVPTEDLAFDGSRFVHRQDPSVNISLRRIAGTVHWNPLALPPEIEPSLEITVHYNLAVHQPADDQDRVNSSATYGFLAEVVMVEVDRATGKVSVGPYISIHDAGRLINPLLAEGQIYGGALHGVAASLYEELRYSPEGQFLSGTFMDYLCPTSAEAPTLQIAHRETPSPFTELGAKGLGEGSTMTAPAAVAAAVEDALRAYGVKVDRIPLTPHRVWALMQQERGRDA